MSRSLSSFSISSRRTCARVAAKSSLRFENIEVRHETVGFQAGSRIGNELVERHASAVLCSLRRPPDVRNLAEQPLLGRQRIDGMGGTSSAFSSIAIAAAEQALSVICGK